VNFLALLLGLGLERTLTRLFHLREFRWLDPLFDRAFAAAAARSGLATLVLALVALVLAAPVAVLSVALADESDFAWLIFAIVILLFSLGPRDLQEEVDDYRVALESGSVEDLRRLTRELTEQSPAQGEEAQRRQIERAICVQANNRMFGVVFWFLVLGPAAPAGAWLFRVADLMRRRAAFTLPPGEVLEGTRRVHGWLAWLPARLVAAAFALVGSFEGALAAWRAGALDDEGPFYERTENLLERVGCGAAREIYDEPGEATVPPAITRPLMTLVWRTLWLIWYPLIALLTLNDWVP
jgi:membrane protein required for beta-lactamase induction